ncbi:hypothetical protein PCAR4_390064 [Paraburkholderia caribensis]|nr:hypothetical protein PCAR4_390064 [Paraburkholderia caribensis]
MVGMDACPAPQPPVDGHSPLGQFQRAWTDTRIALATRGRDEEAPMAMRYRLPRAASCVAFTQRLKARTRRGAAAQVACPTTAFRPCAP